MRFLSIILVPNVGYLFCFKLFVFFFIIYDIITTGDENGKS